ncbi:MAG: signal peptidase I [Candidatus Omnitrophica bacterium]|nr:signal peptidase I [Candidatus Omnitrophota bacterium]
MFNRENVEVVVTAVVLALIIRTFVVQAFKIPTGSMRPTLIEGDRILVNKFIYRFKSPSRGDIVVFKYPEDIKKDFIKRLIAFEGEAVQINPAKDGNIWIDGKLLEEPQMIRATYYYNKAGTKYGEEGKAIKVPEGAYFVLGDNSASSRDSRYWGFVPKKNMVGKAFVIYWPLTRIRILK